MVLERLETVLEKNAAALTAFVEEQGANVRIIREEHPNGLTSKAIKIFRDNHKRFRAAAANTIRICYKLPPTTRNKLLKGAEDTYQALDKDLEHIDEIVKSNDYLNRVYAKSRPETRELYQRMDYLFGVGHDFVFGTPEDPVSAEKQLVSALLIPEEYRIARWRYMLALADQAYDICLTDNRTNGFNAQAEPENHFKLELFAHLYAQLALHPRGRDNECMPITHQLRHNPAIHSLHTTALAHKFFEQTEQQIKLNGNDNKPVLLNNILPKLRKKIMLMALVHDLGESFGEISTGSMVSEMSSEDKVTFNQDRNHIEDAVFLKQIDRVMDRLEVKNGKNGISKEDRLRIKGEIEEAYKTAEATDSFIGRFFKILERMQSQQDYLRFHGMNGAKTLADAKEANKSYTLNYIPSLLFGTSAYNAPVVWDNSLRGLLDKEKDPDMRKACSFLCNAIEGEYKGSEVYHPDNPNAYPGLNRQLAEAIGVEPARFKTNGIHR